MYNYLGLEEIKINNAIINTVEDAQNLMDKYSFVKNNWVSVIFSKPLQTKDTDTKLITILNKINIISYNDCNLFLQYISLLVQYEQDICWLFEKVTRYDSSPVIITHAKLKKIKIFLPQIAKAREIYSTNKKIDTLIEFKKIIDWKDLLNNTSYTHVIMNHRNVGVTIDLLFAEFYIPEITPRIFQFMSLSSKKINQRLIEIKCQQLENL